MLSFLKQAPNRQFARNIVSISLGTGAALAANYFTTVHLARSLGQDQFGNFSFFQSISFYMSLAVDLGLGAWGTRSVAVDPDKRNESLSVILFLRATAISVLAMIIGAILLVPGIDRETGISILLCLLWVVPTGLSMEWLFLGLRRMWVVGVGKFIENGVVLVVALLAVTLPSHGDRALGARAIGAVATIAFLGIVAYRNGFRIQRSMPGTPLIVLSGAKWFWLMALVAQVYNGLDIVLLKFLRPAEEVGSYSAAFRLASLLTLSITLVNVVMYPMIAESYKNDRRSFISLLRLYWGISLAIAAGICAISLFFSEQILQLVYGRKYEGGNGAFKFLLLAAAVLVLNGPISQPMLAAGREKVITRQVIVTAVIYLVLNAAAIPLYGAIGAGVVYLVSVTLGTMMLLPSYGGVIRSYGGSSAV